MNGLDLYRPCRYRANTSLDLIPDATDTQGRMIRYILPYLLSLLY